MIKTGLGDTLAIIIERTGMASLYDIFYDIAGAKNNCKEKLPDSSCQKRQEYFNKLFPFQKASIKVRFIRDYDHETTKDKPIIHFKYGQIENVDDKHVLYHRIFFLGAAKFIEPYGESPTETFENGEISRQNTTLSQ